jgi:hypothetical protein
MEWKENVVGAMQPGVRRFGTIASSGHHDGDYRLAIAGG